MKIITYSFNLRSDVASEKKIYLPYSSIFKTNSIFDFLNNFNIFLHLLNINELVFRVLLNSHHRIL
jgi:hypothetical protein